MISAPAAHRDERFQNDRPRVDPALGGGGLDHAEFAGNVVRGQRHAGKMVRGQADDVEIGEGRLDHDHVGPFGQVQFDLAEGLSRR